MHGIYKRHFPWKHFKYTLCRRNFSRMKNIQGIIFDMDGTLTIPVLNFKDLRQKLGITDNKDILEFVQNISNVEKRKNCYDIIEKFEDEGNEKLTLQPNVFKLFDYLKSKSIHRALITRNNSKCVDSFIKKFLTHEENNSFKESGDIFSVILCRDFKPVKPHPASALHVCKQWNIEPENVLFVGDDQQDLECGKSAGTWTALKLKGTNGKLKEMGDVCVDDLSELIEILEK